MRALIISAAVLELCISQSAASATDFMKSGQPVSEDYRKMFDECDAHNTFGGVPTTLHHGCRADPSHFSHFNKVAAAASAPEAIIISSKIAWDDDGSAKSCSSAHGATSQCQTTLMLKATHQHPCVIKGRPESACVPTDPDRVSYAVIPGGKFSALTGVTMGDYGMVILGDRQVPVIIADSGPSNKVGEGSTTLLKKLFKDGKVHTASKGVVFVLFPGSHGYIGNLSPDDLPKTVESRGTELFKALEAATP